MLRERQRPDALCRWRRRSRWQTAGRIGGSAGSPRPVGGLSAHHEVHFDHRRRLRHADQRYWLKLLCTARPPSNVISCHQVADALDHPPCTWLSRVLGLMIWLPMSPATHTLFTLTRLLGVDASPRRLRRSSRGGCTGTPTPSAGALRQRCVAPARLLAQPASSTPRMRAGVEAVAAALRRRIRRLASRSSRNCSGSLPAACASSSMNDWNTNENALLPRRAQRAGRHAERHQRSLEVEVRDEPRRELVAGDVRRRARSCSPFADYRRSSRSDCATPTSLPDASTPPFRSGSPPGR